MKRFYPIDFNLGTGRIGKGIPHWVIKEHCSCGNYHYVYSLEILNEEAISP